MFGLFSLFGSTPEVDAEVEKHEYSSAKVAKIATRAMKDPKSLTEAEIKSLAASVLTQRPDKKA